MNFHEFGWVLLGMTMIFFAPYITHKFFNQEVRRWVKEKLNIR